MIVVMEPALDVLNRALQGGPGARSFLDRTTSIYILDATEVSILKTYGCWNFIHQALNEVERAEAVSPASKLFSHLQLLVVHNLIDIYERTSCLRILSFAFKTIMIVVVWRNRFCLAELISPLC
jgi:hypothetical protein